jgi:hypothetical protein
MLPGEEMIKGYWRRVGVCWAEMSICTKGGRACKARIEWAQPAAGTGEVVGWIKVHVSGEDGERC